MCGRIVKKKNATLCICANEKPVFAEKPGDLYSADAVQTEGMHTSLPASYTPSCYIQGLKYRHWSMGHFVSSDSQDIFLCFMEEKKACKILCKITSIFMQWEKYKSIMKSNITPDQVLQSAKRSNCNRIRDCIVARHATIFISVSHRVISQHV